MENSHPLWITFRGAGRRSAPVCGVVIGMDGNEAEEIAFSECEGAHLVAQTERIDARTVRCLEMLDRFPLEARVPIDRTPVEFAQAAQGCDDLLQLRRLEAKEDVLELGTVEIEADPPSVGGHASGSRPWRSVPTGCRRRSPSESLSRPKRDLA